MQNDQDDQTPFNSIADEDATDKDTPLQRFIDWVLDIEDLVSCLMAFYECQQHHDPMNKFNESLECSWSLSPFHQGYWTSHYSTRRKRFQSRFADKIQRKREDGNYELDALAILSELERIHLVGVFEVHSIDKDDAWTDTAIERTLAFCRAPSYRLLRSKWIKSHIECIESLAIEFKAMVAVGQTAMEEQYLSQPWPEPDPNEYSAGEDGFRRDKRINELIESGMNNSQIEKTISDESGREQWEPVQASYIAATQTRYCQFIGMKKQPRKGGRPRGK